MPSPASLYWEVSQKAEWGDRTYVPSGGNEHLSPTQCQLRPGGEPSVPTLFTVNVVFLSFLAGVLSVEA